MQNFQKKFSWKIFKKFIDYWLSKVDWFYNIETKKEMLLYYQLSLLLFRKLHKIIINWGKINNGCKKKKKKKSVEVFGYSKHRGPRQTIWSDARLSQVIKTIGNVQSLGFKFSAKQKFKKIRPIAVRQKKRKRKCKKSLLKSSRQIFNFSSSATFLHNNF